MLNPKNLEKGKEQYEFFYSVIGDKSLVQYDYRDVDGELFSIIKTNLEDARKEKSKWLINKENK